MGDFWTGFYKYETNLGGGKELMFLVGFSFVFASREKFFYYLGMLSLDKLYISYLKLAYARPRPYMIDGEITPVKCSKAFGSPSGHSSASIIITLALFLDWMHG